MQLMVAVFQSPTLPAGYAWGLLGDKGFMLQGSPKEPTRGDAGEADRLQAGEHRVGLCKRDAPQLDVGARGNVAAACIIPADW